MQYVTDECAGSDPSVLSGCARSGRYNQSINQSCGNAAEGESHNTNRSGASRGSLCVRARAGS